MKAREFYPPFFIMPIPLNKNGEGPASEAETVTTVYQIWDGANQTFQSFNDERGAREALALLDGVTEDWPTYGSFRFRLRQLRIRILHFLITLLKYFKLL